MERGNDLCSAGVQSVAPLVSHVSVVVPHRSRAASGLCFLVHIRALWPEVFSSRFEHREFGLFSSVFYVKTASGNGQDRVSIGSGFGQEPVRIGSGLPASGWFLHHRAGSIEAEAQANCRQRTGIAARDRTGAKALFLCGLCVLLRQLLRMLHLSSLISHPSSSLPSPARRGAAGEGARRPLTSDL